MLEYWPPDSKKNYRSKGYEGLNDGLTGIFDRFEDADEPYSTIFEAKKVSK